MKLAYKYRFCPTSEQAKHLAQTFGCVRYVYNFGLALRKESYEQENKSLSYKDTSSALTNLKKAEETRWLNDVSCVPLQQSLRHLNTAYSNFFASCSGKRSKRAGFPSFKSKHHNQSAEYTRSAFKYSISECADGTSAGTPSLQLAKMRRPLKVRWSRIPPSNPSTVTVSRDKAGRYFVSLLCEYEPEPLPTTEKEAGIDLGLTHFAITSDGVKFDNPRHLEADLKRLRRAQKALSRKQKGSNNRYKARRKVARIHARIADKRRDFLHKLSTQLVRENQALYVETLNVSGMMKNHRLARHIAGASWSEFVRQLEYKSKLYGRRLTKISQWEPSSKTCSAVVNGAPCKHQVKELPLSVRNWTCEACGSVLDRDINAAMNIRAAGQRMGVGQTQAAKISGNACGENVRPVPPPSTGGRDRAVSPRRYTALKQESSRL